MAKSSFIYIVILFSLLIAPLQTPAQDAVHGAPLTLGTTNGGRISLPGQEDRFHFTGTMGQRLYFDALDSNPAAITATFSAPSGVQVLSVNHNGDAGPFYLKESGTYTLNLDGITDATGDYLFRLVDLAEAIIIGIGATNTGKLAPQTQTAFYCFRGTNGCRLNLRSVAASSGFANWRLVSPANQNLAGPLAINSDLGDVVLPVTGDYLIVVSGYTGDPGTLEYQFSVSLVSEPSGGTSGFGIVRSGTVHANETNSFSYTGPAGLPIYFDSLTNNNSYLQVEFISPSNEVVFSANALTDAGLYVLPRSGDYRLNVIAGANDADFVFRLLDLNASATPITNGAVYFESFSAISSFRADIFYFTASPGQQFYYDSLKYDYNSVLSMMLPNGQSSSTSWDSDLGPFSIDVPGVYFLILTSLSAQQDSDYIFRLIESGQAPAIPAAFDIILSGTNSYGSAASLFRFTGNAGQRLFFNNDSMNGGGTAYLYGPDCGYLAGSSFLNGDFEVTLPGNGQYLLVAGNAYETNSAAFSFQIVTPTSTNQALTLGAEISGTLGEAGEEDRFTFTGKVGQRLYYDALQFDFSRVVAYLLNPSGVPVHMTGINADYDWGPFTLSESGKYTLVLKAASDSPGDYQFRLIDIMQPPASAAPLDTPIFGTNYAAIAASVYRFNGSAGERLFIGGTGTNAGSLVLYGPGNAYLGANSLNGYFEATLAQTGTHVLVAGNLFETNTALFSFRILTPNTATNALAFGTIVTGTLNEPGEENRFTFTGTAGQRLYYDALQADNENLTVGLLNPRGDGLYWFGNADLDAGVHTLANDGFYTLVFHAPSETTGTYAFHLLDLAAQSAVHYDTPVTNRLAPQISAQLYRITGTAGQRLGITNISASGTHARWSLLSPANDVMLSDNIMNNLGEITLPVSGNYALLIAGMADLDGTLDYEFQVSLVSNASGSPVGFGVEHTGDITPEQTNAFPYYGVAGQVIYFDSLTQNGAASVRLIDPAGESFFHANGGYDAGPFFLTRTGNYLLEVTGSFNGSYDFRLLDFADATNVVIGTKYAQTLVPPLRADLYRFDGTSGQKIYCDSELAQGFYSETTTLYSPSGRILQAFFGGLDIGSLLLTETGTYYLVLNGYSVTEGQGYAFRFLDANQPPTKTLPFDTALMDITDPGASINLYRFDGTAGQRLFFDAAPTNGYGSWELFSPAGNRIGYQSLSADFEVPLPLTGQYMLTIGNSSETTPTSYSIQVVTPTTATNKLVINAVHSDSLSEVGEEDWFTFTANAGQRLYYDGLDGDADNLQVRLTDPLGNVILDANAEWDSDPLVLTSSGTYALRIKHYADGTGNYQFRILDIADASTLVLDSVISGAVTNPYGAQIFSVPITPGLRFIVDGLGEPSWLGQHRLYGQNASLLGAGAFGTDLESTPTYDGDYLLVLRSSVNASVPYSFQIVPGNHAPVLNSIGDLTNSEMTLLSFTASAADLEAPNDQLTFSLDPGAPASATINPATGQFTWTPDETNGPGIFPVTVLVTDNSNPNLRDSKTFNIVVNEVNRPPSLILPADQMVSEFGAFKVNVSGSDPDKPMNMLTFSLLSPPSGMTINPVSGAIAWIPSETQGSNAYTIAVVVSDTNPPAVNARQLSQTNAFTVTVLEVNVPPVLPMQTNRTINELSLLYVTNTATDADLPLNALGYTLSEFPAGATISSNGIISWTPTEAQGPGTYTFTTVVTDTNSSAANAQNLKATNTFVVTVTEVNSMPVLPVQANRTITELTLLSVTNSATDPDLPSNPLFYTLTEFPAGATISSNGIITWTPTEAQGPGSYIFTTVATDTNPPASNAQNLKTTNTFTVTVSESNQPPALTLPVDQEVNEMIVFTTSAGGIDPDLPANPLVFSLVSGPPGLSVSTNGAISWTPSELQGPGVYNVQLCVFDTNAYAISANSLSVTGKFTLTVKEVNRAPTLLPPADRTIHAGTTFSATASATDPDIPFNTLKFAKVSGPDGVQVRSDGLVTWNTSEIDANTTNTLTLKVTDSGFSILEDITNFVITVVSPPAFLSVQTRGNSVIPLWTSIAGTTYRLQYKSNINNEWWVDLSGDVLASGPTASKEDSTLGTNTTRFYRLFVSP